MSRISTRGIWRILSPEAVLFHTVIQGKIESPWNTMALVGFAGLSEAIAACPALAVSRPARMRKRVVLPQPEGPTIVQKLPRGMSSEIPSSAVKRPPRVAKVFVRPAIAIFAAVVSGAVLGRMASSGTAILVWASSGRLLGLVPGIHAFMQRRHKTWVAGTSPATGM